MTALVEVADVGLSIRGLQILDDVSFTVGEGEFFAIIGPNGAGKTSLLNVLNGVYRPTTGAVHIDGTDIARKNPADIAALGVARTFQNLALFESMGIVDNILLGRQGSMRAGFLTGAFWVGRASREERAARRACEPIIELTGLGEYLGRPVVDLPYGIKKRIELARALAMNPRVLLLDEPAAGLNDDETAELGEWIRTASSQMNVTVLMIEHDMALVMQMADRTLVLDFGQVVCCERPSVAVADPRVISAYLGAPLAPAEPGPGAASLEDVR